MEMKYTGIQLSCMDILTFCFVKGVEEAARLFLMDRLIS